MGTYTGTVPTFSAGSELIAAQMAEISNFMTAATGAWTSYTPTWTSTVTNPTIGNGTLTGAYRQLGKTVDVRIRLVWGSTTTAGSGSAYLLGYPPPGPAVAETAGGAIIVDNSPDGRYPGTVWLITSAGGIRIHVSGSPATSATHWAPGYPITFATNDVIVCAGTYEIA